MLLSADTPSAAADEDIAETGAITTKHSFSPGLPGRLAGLEISLAFTSYQSGMLNMLGSQAGHGPQLHQSAVGKPMGITIDGMNGFVLVGANTITRYRNVLNPSERIDHIFDACYMPRETWLTGGLDAHDVAVDADGQVIFVNTAFNCLATLSPVHSFTPVWRPRFISALVNEDRCHLNGLAMEAGRPAFVTAASRSDTIDGWRDRRDGGGVAIDVRSGEIVCSGLSMPHSPRVHRGRLWLLNSGTGELGRVGDNGLFEPAVFCPGFVRGLAFHDNLAFVALSKPRHERFDGLPLDRRLAEADSDSWCGLQVIDLDTGTCVDWFRIDGDVIELYDVAVMAGHLCPMAVSPSSADAFNLITIGEGPSTNTST
ncbi:TIGR03032 family protein [Sphingomonas sp. AP4-R1]|uniref:TIGR03032 family protein n=1 Tax=Sphingomonas sp. AP4-R1 TaxID=2735134 RepID=UPI001493A6A2|nr:TIGR03032 family protein [Sphingomonas sp. AP4-R1]QJU60055.1 TIGR03032 family protein [Sphingomonas sp. AP4-R1]